MRIIFSYPASVFLEKVFCHFSYFMSGTYNVDKYLLLRSFIGSQRT